MLGSDAEVSVVTSVLVVVATELFISASMESALSASRVRNSFFFKYENMLTMRACRIVKDHEVVSDDKGMASLIYIECLQEKLDICDILPFP